MFYFREAVLKCKDFIEIHLSLLRYLSSQSLISQNTYFKQVLGMIFLES